MNKRIGVIGLGYVGLPLAVSLAKHFLVKGYDISKNRLQELRSGFDRTHEIEEAQLRASFLGLHDDIQDLKD